MGLSSRRIRVIAGALGLVLIIGAGSAALAARVPASDSPSERTSQEALTPDAKRDAITTEFSAAAAAAAAAAASAAAAAAAAGAGPLAVPASTTAIAGWLHADGATLRTADNEPYVIRAVSWFGMETSNCAPHGLWAISLDAGLAHIKSMGFNTVRLPFSNECLASASTNSINYELNPTLAGKPAVDVMDAVIATAKAHSLSVILDRHRPDSAGQSELWYTDGYSEARWISDWQALATRYRDEPAVVGFDLHNEPHGAACWGCGDPATDWQAAATRAGNAVLAINPRVLVIVEGIERQSNGSSTWWGGGLSGVKTAPVTLDLPGQVVYSPHDYPASVYEQKWFSAANYPDNLTTVWDANWGYIAKSGIAPVLLGEFGTTLQTRSDEQWLAALVNYLGDTGISFAYWSFNPNSGDTGGLVQDDWVTPQAAKLAALAPLLGPSQAPAAPSPSVSTPTRHTPTPHTPTRTTPTATPRPAPAPVPSSPGTNPGTNPGTGTIGVPSVQAEWALQSSWETGYVADVKITSATGASSWTVSWNDPAVTRVLNSWGMSCTVAVGSSITCTGVDWAASLAPGQTHTVGLQVEASAAPQSPTLTVTD
ncbi:endoglucanase [Glaciihabitans tibetensis]|uniref:Endoglucanase n=1 Tax=Glaciihabitans tibetensis TaxID=1266600 RepID=A0A2T0VEF7_9MICO|nr:cellulase family glycosylhydrolase [Glaciihabitans tibetensis]PRY68561.1 endoglucanase [Glaciihabitans tibetensis]